MANEIEVSLAVKLTRDDDVLIDFVESQLNLSQVGSRSLSQLLSVTTAPATFPIPAGTLGYIGIKNNATQAGNEMHLLSSTGGIAVARIGPGEISFFKIGTAITSPALSIASTAANATMFIMEL